MPDTVFLIDTFSLMFQVFHAIPPMTSPTGQPTNAVFGFSRDLVSLLQVHRPAWLICALESPGIGEREKLYPEYKANRGEMPEDLRPQIPLLIETFEAFRLPVVNSAGWEADDVIATLTREAVARGHQVRIVTSDKDARQLLGPQVQILNLRKGAYLDEAALLADWGVRPDQVVDFQALVGDAVDNVPGVPLVGPKKAQALLQQFETLEGVLANADKAPGAKLKENLKTFADQARLSQTLVRLNQHLDLNFDWDASRNPQPDVPALQSLFRKFGFGRLVNDVKQFAPAEAASPPASRKSEQRPAGRSLFDEDEPDASAASIPGPRSDGASPVPSPPFSGERARVRGPSGDDASHAQQSHDTERGTDGNVVGSESTPIGIPLDSEAPSHPNPLPPKAGGEGTGEVALAASSSTRHSSPITRHWETIDTPDKLAAFIDQLKQQPRFCLDLETTGLDPRSDRIVGWAFCWQAGMAYYLPTLGPLGSTLLRERDVIDAVQPVLESPSLRLVNQNLKFDLMFLDSHGIHVRPECIDIDPMVGDYLLDAGARSHSLDTLIEKYLGTKGIPISDLIGTGKKQKSMADVPIDLIAEYATEDADLTLRLADLIAGQLREQGLWDLYWDLERPLIPLLAEIEQTGIRVDADELRRQSADLNARLEQLISEIHTLAGREFNIDSPKQLQVILFDELKLPIKRKTKTGASTDQEVLEELAALHPLPAKIIEHRHLSKLKGTYLDALPQLVHPRTGRIHTSFNQVVAATGRLSSSDPNLQNIPIRTPEGERIRRAFIAGDISILGFVPSPPSAGERARVRGPNGDDAQKNTRDLFSDSDPVSTPLDSTASPHPNSLLKNVAWTPRPSDNPLETDGRGVHPTVLQQAANLLPPRSGGEGTEIWKLVCADYSQIELRVLAHFSQDRELIAAFAQGIDIHTAVAAQVFRVERNAVSSDQRRMAKAVNFGVIYGQSAFGLAAALGIEQDEAAAFIDGYFAKYSGVTQFIEETLTEVQQTGRAITILGRRRPIEGIRALRTGNLNMSERTAVNSVIQGSAADLIKRAMLVVRKRLRDENHPGRMLLQIHDELVFEAPQSEVASLIDLVRHEMQHAMELTVPLVVDVSVGDNWLDTQPV